VIAANDNEEWRQCVQAPDYMVSSLGRVRNARGKSLRLANTNERYPTLSLMVSGTPKRFALHVLVCTAFHGVKPSPRHEVMHENDDYSRHTKFNLHWGTSKENSAAKVRERRKWTDAEYLAVGFALRSGTSKRSLSRQFDCAKSQIQGMANSKRMQTLLAANDNTLMGVAA
jgi:hypothetical protein